MAARRLHPFDVASRVLAERLNGLDASSDLRAALGGDEIDWAGVVGLTSEQFVLAAFAAAVRDLGLAGALDPELRDFLAAVHTANVERNRRLRAQLTEVVACLNRIGIEPVLLKGAIRLVDDLYPDPGWRMMWDLDVLVSQTAFPAAIDELQGGGYAAVRSPDHSRKDVKLRRNGLACVEIHRQPFGPARQQRLLTGGEVIRESRPAVLDGLRVRLPSPEHQLVHVVGHGHIGHHGHAYGRIALRDRLEAAALIRWSRETIDWNAVFARFTVAGYRRPLLSFLLSLGDGGLSTMPVAARRDPLAVLQERRIALQARSPVMRRVGLYAGWCAVLLAMQTWEHEAGRPRIVRTLRTLVRDHEARRRMLHTLIHGMPRPW